MDSYFCEICKFLVKFKDSVAFNAYDKVTYTHVIKFNYAITAICNLYDNTIIN